jgi:outer membrane protein OmpA-like peptidoglycan-associated protein
MFRAILVLAACLSILWFRPTPADACGVKMSIKAPRVKRTVVARRASPTPRQTLVARRPVRVGPPARSPVSSGGSASAGASVEASTTDESTEAATPTEETATEETRVATADTAAKEPVEAEAVVEPEPEPKEAKVPARFAKRVFFGQANAVLSSKAKASLVRNARWLKRHEDRSVVVEGHCSVTGPAAPNMALSEARAEAVKDFLVEMGVDESRIETKGYGLTKPRYKPGSSPKNRRVIIRVRKD